MLALDWIMEHGTHLRSLNASTLRRKLGREPRTCTWCGGEVGKGRQTWCSSECVEEFRTRCDPQFVANRIDRWLKGGRTTHWRELRCESCGLDVAARLNTIAWMRRRVVGVRPRRRSNVRARKRAHRTIMAAHLYRAQWDRSVLSVDRWELDHVLPVCEGGGLCGPEGLRVLCVPCHRRATAALRKRLAARASA